MNADEQGPPHSGRSHRARVLLLVAVAALAAAITWSLPPQPQWEAYHDFADKRTVLGVSNFLDVVSNLPFAVVGAAGLWWLIRDAAAARRGKSSRLGWQDRYTFGAMFVGVLLTAAGSGYYHLAPDTARLFWDRLPMAVALMGLLAGLISERIDRNAGAVGLVPLLLLGIASVVYWRWTERQGAGDLRLYGFAHALPLLAALYLALALPARYLPRRSLLIALGWYAVAKLLEVLDAWIFSLGGIVSGHTLKHLAAAMGTYWILRTIAANAARPSGA